MTQPVLKNIAHLKGPQNNHRALVDESKSLIHTIFLSLEIVNSQTQLWTCFFVFNFITNHTSNSFNDWTILKRSKLLFRTMSAFPESSSLSTTAIVLNDVDNGVDNVVNNVDCIVDVSSLRRFVDFFFCTCNFRDS